jgi:hypothetical protein
MAIQPREDVLALKSDELKGWTRGAQFACPDLSVEVFGCDAQQGGSFFLSEYLAAGLQRLRLGVFVFGFHVVFGLKIR